MTIVECVALHKGGRPPWEALEFLAGGPEPHGFVSNLEDSMRGLKGIAVALALAAIVQPWATASAHECKGGYASSMSIGGEVTNAKVYDLAALQAEAVSQLTVAYYSGSSGMQTYSFIGVPLINLLNEAGIVTDSGQKNDSLRKYLVITASDCYQVVLSLAELLPTFGGDPVMLAYADGDGVPLSDTQGMARLVVPGDKSGGRYVSNVVRIVVRSPGVAPQTK